MQIGRHHLALHAAVALALAGCPSSMAHDELVSRGCEDIELTWAGVGSYDYTARCDGRYCTGNQSIGLSSSSSQSSCTSVPPPGTVVDGPGQVVMGQGSTTGMCSTADYGHVLSTLLPEMRSCYNGDLRRYPDMGGFNGFAWTVDPSGGVTVDRSSSDLPVLRCMEQVIAGASWPRAELGSCRAQWTLVLHTGTPVEERGHDRLPSSEVCEPFWDVEPQPGERVLTPDALAPTLGGRWDLKSLDLWTSYRLREGEPGISMVRADRFATPGPDTLTGRTTMLCHNQKLRYRTTTTTDEHGKTTRTQTLAPDDAVRQSGNASVPWSLPLDADRVPGQRKLVFQLSNGKLTTELTDVVVEEVKIADLLDGFEGRTDFTAAFVERDGELVLLMNLTDEGEPAVSTRAIYTRVDP